MLQPHTKQVLYAEADVASRHWSTYQYWLFSMLAPLAPGAQKSYLIQLNKVESPNGLAAISSNAVLAHHVVSSPPCCHIHAEPAGPNQLALQQQGLQVVAAGAINSSEVLASETNRKLRLIGWVPHLGKVNIHIFYIQKIGLAGDCTWGKIQYASSQSGHRGARHTFDHYRCRPYLKHRTS